METTQTPPDVTVVFPGAIADEISISMSPLLMQQWKQIAVAAALVEANATIERQKAAMAAMEQVNGQQAVKLREALDVIAEQSRRIALLEKPVVTLPPVTPAPPVVPGVPVDFAPVITKERPVNIIMGSIVKDDTPGDKQDDITRQAIDQAAAVGCNCVTFFMNEDEIKKHLAPSIQNDPRRNLFKYAHSLALIVGADTIDALLRTIPETPDDARLNFAIDGLIRLGARFLIWNDVDGLNKDGTRVYPPDAIKRGMHRIRRALVEYPDMPVMASLTAAADPAFYQREYGFDWVEIQTFGSIPELQGFMAKPFDVFCIDTQNAVGINYLQKSRAILVNSTATCLRLYAIFDYDGNDFRKDNFKEEKAEISKTLEYFKEARRSPRNHGIMSMS